MTSREACPIRLKQLVAEPTRDVRAMLADLEGTPSRRRTPKAIWTRAFLASGKIAGSSS